MYELTQHILHHSIKSHPFVRTISVIFGITKSLEMRQVKY